jgi:hypothetical protein
MERCSGDQPRVGLEMGRALQGKDRYDLVMGCGQLVLYDVTPSTSNTMLELEADRLSDQERRIWPPLLQGPKTLRKFNEGSGRGGCACGG